MRCAGCAFERSIRGRLGRGRIWHIAVPPAARRSAPGGSSLNHGLYPLPARASCPRARSSLVFGEVFGRFPSLGYDFVLKSLQIFMVCGQPNVLSSRIETFGVFDFTAKLTPLVPIQDRTVYLRPVLVEPDSIH